VGECEFSPGSRIQIRVDSIYIQYCYTLRDTERSVVKWEGAWYYGNSYIQHRDGMASTQDSSSRANRELFCSELEKKV
jgi:hypothetical protein